MRDEIVRRRERPHDSTSETGAGADFVEPGKEFTRDTRYITTRITADGRDGYPVEPGRYRLIVARACPWANRAIIVRRLLGLEDVLSMGICGPTHDERSWTFDLDPGGVDPVLRIPRLQDAYFARFPDYPRGITVPAMVEISTGQVVPTTSPRSLSTCRPSGNSSIARAPPTCIPKICAPRSTRCPIWCSTTSTTGCTAAASPDHRTPTTPPTTDSSPDSTGSPNACRHSASWWATPSPRPTSAVHDARPIRRRVPRTFQVQPQQAVGDACAVELCARSVPDARVR